MSRENSNGESSRDRLPSCTVNSPEGEDLRGQLERINKVLSLLMSKNSMILSTVLDSKNDLMDVRQQIYVDRARRESGMDISGSEDMSLESSYNPPVKQYKFKRLSNFARQDYLKPRPPLHTQLSRSVPNLVIKNRNMTDFMKQRNSVSHENWVKKCIEPISSDASEDNETPPNQNNIKRKYHHSVTENDEVAPKVPTVIDNSVEHITETNEITNSLSTLKSDSDRINIDEDITVTENKDAPQLCLVTEQDEVKSENGSHMGGQYVVKPQDEEKARASGPSAIELERLGRLRSPESRASVPRTTGHSSLGAVHSNNGNSSRASLQANWAGGTGGRRERRRSAGDEGALRQLNMLVRTRTDSGKQLTDMEILEQVTVLNLDTGERVPLSVAEDKIPQCINPLSLHIMRLTSEYVSNSSIYDEDKNRESDDENMTHSGNGSRGNGGKEGSGTTGRGTGVTLGADGNAISSHADEAATGGLRRKTAKFKRFLGSTVKKTMDKAKSIAQEVSHARHKEDISDIIDEVHGEHNIKLKASNSHKGPYDFEGCMRHVQEITNWHSGPVWCMKFSACGRLLATAGQDRLLRVWVLRDAQEFFQDMRTKYNADQKSSPTPSQESLGPGIVGGAAASTAGSIGAPEEPPGPAAPFAPLPFCSYSGHTSDLLDVAWSKNYFILSSSMDKTVRLWHISRGECLCCFQHIDFVTAIAFHPRDDRYFLSGSLDGKLRLWNIPDKKVAVWNEVDGQTKLITAANFCQNGKFAVVGTYDGRCIFYTTDQLKYHTQIDVRSTRGKNSTGRKISGIEPMPGEDKILVTSNDSRIRLYDLRDLNLSCKYKGYVNISSQIKASFSHDGKYIVSGSENQCIYIWKTHHDYSKFSSVRRDRNDFWEGIKAHNAVVTCAVFAPNPESILRMIEEREREARAADASDDNPGKEITNPVTITGHILVSADFTGCIRVFVNKAKPKHSSLPASAMA